MRFGELLEYDFLKVGNYSLNLLKILSAAMIFFIAWFFVLVLSNGIRRLAKKRKFEEGKVFSIIQLAKYVIYVIATLLALQAIGVQLSVVWAGAAALLVGFGLGLQQTFSDLISGIIILIEGTIEIGDVVMVDSLIGKVRNIGLRTSQIETRDEIIQIVPNSHFVASNVINWTHSELPTRFHITVGVSYSSDVELVTNLLLQAAMEHPKVLKEPAPTVIFKDFGNSSLDFELYFFTEDNWNIEVIRSDIRYGIIRAFRSNNVEIPFPQQDIWFRNPMEMRSGNS